MPAQLHPALRARLRPPIILLPPTIMRRQTIPKVLVTGMRKAVNNQNRAIQTFRLIIWFGLFLASCLLR